MFTVDPVAIRKDVTCARRVYVLCVRSADAAPARACGWLPEFVCAHVDAPCGLTDKHLNRDYMIMFVVWIGPIWSSAVHYAYRMHN